MNDTVNLEVLTDDPADAAHIDHAKTMKLMADIVDLLNTRSVTTMEGFTIINSLFLSIIGTVPPEFRWRARTQLWSMMMRASVAQDAVFHIHQQPETTQ